MELKVRRTLWAHVGGGVPAAPPYTIYTRIGAFLPLPSGEVAMPLGVDGEGARTKMKPLFDLAGRPALSVTCGDSSPKGGAKTYLYRTCIGAFLPLPSGEVAMPQALTERGRGRK